MTFQYRYGIRPSEILGTQDIFSVSWVWICCSLDERFPLKPPSEAGRHEHKNLEERLKGLVILKRLPDRSAILSVYAIIVLFVYGWTVYWILWKFPSWIYYLTTTEILLIICYAVVVNLLESLVFILGVLVLGVVAPKAWFADRFVSTGSLLSLLLASVLIVFSARIRLADSFAYTPLIQMGTLFLLALGIAMLLPRYRPVAGFLEQLADRAKIFLYLSLPVSFVSLLVVIFRSLILGT